MVIYTSLSINVQNKQGVDTAYPLLTVTGFIFVLLFPICQRISHSNGFNLNQCILRKQ